MRVFRSFDLSRERGNRNDRDRKSWRERKEEERRDDWMLATSCRRRPSRDGWMEGRKEEGRKERVTVKGKFFDRDDRCRLLQAASSTLWNMKCADRVSIVDETLARWDI